MQIFFRTILAVLGLILLIDGLYLLAQGKIHLGIILPILIGLIFCIHAIFWQSIQKILQGSKRLKRLWQSCWIIFSIWLFSLILFFFYIQMNKNNEAKIQPVKAIIILGSGLIQGKPSPTLQARLDRAAEIHQHTPNAIMIVTGGLGLAQKQTEAQVMSQYLQQHYQINSNNIILEDQSTSTELNLKNSQSILIKHQISLNDPIAITTSDFHTPRAQAIARKLGYQNIYSYSANTPLETRYNAWLREYFAYISGWILGEY